MTTFADLLDARTDGDAVRYRFDTEMRGAFGGIFGGLLAAAAVHTAGRNDPDRLPAGVDCRFLRALPPGDAVATAAVLRAGRTITVLGVEIRDERDRLATTATVSLAAPDALHRLDRHGPEAVSPTRWRPWTLPAGVEAPIVGLLEPQLAAADGDAVAVDIAVPWDAELDATTAEAACVAGDLCVGPPVAAACADAWLPHPNPDLTLRFAPTVHAPKRVTGVGRVVRISGGLGVVAIDVQAGGAGFASGAATSLVLRGESRPDPTREEPP